MPFQHRAVILGLKSAFFRGPRSFAACNPDLFQVRINNKEVYVVPPSMIALVATAVSSCILYDSSLMTLP